MSPIPSVSGPPKDVSSRSISAPAYASIGDLTAAFPQLAGVQSYTIRVHYLANSFDPPREDSIWVFVAVTNNETQQVTVIAP